MSDRPGPPKAADWRRPPGAAERAALVRDSQLAVGLCPDCSHLRLLTTGRSRFVRCWLAETEAEYPRYPPLPVLECAGYRAWRDG